MQVLVTDWDHEKRARDHCDKHLNKLLTESVQILNTALYVNDAEEYAFYQKAYENHPWVVWSASSVGNWAWLREHALALSAEYTRRHDDVQEAGRKLSELWSSSDLVEIGSVLPSGQLTPIPLAIDDEYIVEEDPIESYREYVRHEKSWRPWFDYTNEPPEWL